MEDPSEPMSGGYDEACGGVDEASGKKDTQSISSQIDSDFEYAHKMQGHFDSLNSKNLTLHDNSLNLDLSLAEETDTLYLQSQKQILEKKLDNMTKRCSHYEAIAERYRALSTDRAAEIDRLKLEYLPSRMQDLNSQVVQGILAPSEEPSVFEKAYDKEKEVNTQLKKKYQALKKKYQALKQENVRITGRRVECGGNEENLRQNLLQERERKNVSDAEPTPALTPARDQARVVYSAQDRRIMELGTLTPQHSTATSGVTTSCLLESYKTFCKSAIVYTQDGEKYEVCVVCDFTVNVKNIRRHQYTTHTVPTDIAV